MCFRVQSGCCCVCRGRPKQTPNSATNRLLPPHLRLALKLQVKLLHSGLQLAHALTTTNQQDGGHVLQQTLQEASTGEGGKSWWCSAAVSASAVAARSFWNNFQHSNIKSSSLCSQPHVSSCMLKSPRHRRPSGIQGQNGRAEPQQQHTLRLTSFLRSAPLLGSFLLKMGLIGSPYSTSCSGVRPMPKPSCLQPTTEQHATRLPSVNR